MRVVSFNVRYADVDEGARAWSRRRANVVETLRRLRPDLLGLQEVWLDQLSHLRDRLPGYEWVGQSVAGGHHTPIGVRTDRLALCDTDTFALSETPADLGSVGWDATYPRLGTTATVRDRRTGRELTHCNVHFDHKGATARAESAALVAQRVDRPAVLTGDLNCRPDTAPYDRLLDAGFLDPAAAVDPYGPSETYVGFGDADPRRIDYVLPSAPVVADYGVGPATGVEGAVASDHRPVVLDIRDGSGSQ